MQEVAKHYPQLSHEQLEQLSRFQSLLLEWNDKLNLISRQEALHFEERHLLSSLAILKLISFPDNAQIMDVGTGGGLPGIPLAIAFPNCNFLLVDSIAKKINAVNHMIETLGLNNAKAVQTRVETIEKSFDFVTGRAVKALPLFMSWVVPKLKKGEIGGWKRGVVYLKGGDLNEEFKALGCTPEKTLELSEVYSGIEFFETKKVLFFNERHLKNAGKKPGKLK